MGDFLYAVRSARKRPLFSLTIILILGVGIGATTAVFSIVDGLLLEPLPYPEPGRLVRVWKNDIARGYPHYPLTYPEYEQWIEASESFESAALMVSPVHAEPALTPEELPDYYQGASYTMTQNLTGWPAAVVRAGTSSKALPIGVQITAAPWRDDVALAGAKCVEDLPCLALPC